MADIKGLGGALLVGLAIGGGTGVALDPIKSEKMQDISVAEMVASKLDSTAQRIEAADVVREAGRNGPRVVIRPEAVIRVLDVPTGSRVRNVTFIDEKIVAEWTSDVTEAPDSGKVTRFKIEANLYDQVR